MAGIGSWGGGIVLLIAAVLWVVYLMPSWAARRQYLATERNAIRLQQTLRILAQTAELPDEVRVEMNAKSLAEAQRVARSEEAKRAAIVRAHEAARQREITRRLAEQQPKLERASSVPALTAMRMRRSRLGATLFGTLGVVLAVVVFTAAPSAWLVGVAGLVAAGGSAAVLAQLHQVAQARKARAAAGAAEASRASRPTAATTWTDPAPPLSTEQPAGPVRDRSWTPAGVPKPLYVERPTAPAPTPESSAELAARLRERVAEAKAEAEAEAAAIRAGEQDPSLARVSRMRPDVEAAVASLSAHDQGRLAERLGLRAPAAGAATASPAAERAAAEPAAAVPSPTVEPEQPAAPSRWAGMGVIDEDAYQQTDLDAIMRRRRAV